jgi:hypothetical protein
VAGYDEVERYADLVEEQHELAERVRGVMGAAPDWQQAKFQRFVELQQYCRPTGEDLREAVAAPDRRAGAVYAMRAHLRTTDGHLAYLPEEGELDQVGDEAARNKLWDLRQRLLQNRARLAECVDATTSGTGRAATVAELVEDSDELGSADELVAHLRDAERLLVEQHKPLEDAQRDTLRDNWLEALDAHLPPRVADDDEGQRRANAFAVRTIHDLLIPLKDVLVKATGGSDDDR